MLENTTAKNIDGRALAVHLKEGLIKRIDILKKKHNVRPGLAIIRVGDDPASQVYVASKKRQCKEIGIRSFEHVLSSTIEQKALLDLIQSINEDPEIHGLIVQLPLPKHFNSAEIIQAISPRKDVDGLHPLNLGKLFCGIEGGFTPCTPKGCIKLIHTVQKDLKGLKAVVVGASNLVGKPLAHLLLREGATVSLLNSKTKNPKSLCSQADVIVAAAGIPCLIQGDWVKKGALVIDVGINHLVDEQGKPYLVGDVDYEAVSKKAKAMTPVPGGVGPMTVACLLENTVIAVENLYS
ncbi:MAG TPA: bifunctional methylenetetrahydrofolate dehydrogenase/methenyltetrahydrofolate cyclohydrolase FolD [Holosporales bacterium]|nr:bifunctional methylenetetrahydrofolate dehydrogenase/methenyltetrahydrofolate cyclohydrolase FolD [Holosporales bacterium]